MSVLPGHEDLKPRVIVGFDSMGYALVQHGEDVRRYRMSVGPGGTLHAQPLADTVPQLPDQLQEVSASTIARVRNYDQF